MTRSLPSLLTPRAAVDIHPRRRDPDSPTSPPDVGCGAPPPTWLLTFLSKECVRIVTLMADGNAAEGTSVPTKSGRVLTPFNQNIKWLRHRDNRSQEELAAYIRKLGRELGEPNDCTKRLVQKWESGEHESIRPNYRRILELIYGITYRRLCEPWGDPESEIEAWSEAESLLMAVRSLRGLLETVSDRVAGLEFRPAMSLRPRRIRSHSVRS